MGIRIFVDNEANPSRFDFNQLRCGTFETLQEAINYAHGVSYNYVEFVDDNGEVVTPVNDGPVNFLLFAGDNYYPSGGYFDLRAKAATEDELRDIIEANKDKSNYGNNKFQWWQIVNANTHTIVDEGQC